MDNSVRYNHQVKSSTGEATENMSRVAKLHYMKDLSVYLVKPTCCKAWEYKTCAHEHEPKRFEKDGACFSRRDRLTISYLESYFTRHQSFFS